LPTPADDDPLKAVAEQIAALKARIAAQDAELAWRRAHVCPSYQWTYVPYIPAWPYTTTSSSGGSFTVQNT
jgi:hypothetical protein